MADEDATLTKRGISDQLARLAQRLHVAGLQYVAMREGTVWLEECKGLADHAGRRPVTPSTTFNGYSLAKPFTSAAILALCSEGKLALDLPIGLAAGRTGLDCYGTVAETMLHRAGFRNPNPLGWYHLAAEHAAFDEAAFVDERIADLQGTKRGWSASRYSNLGYLLLGRCIELSCRLPVAEALRASVIASLPLGSGDKLAFEINNLEDHARGHLRRFAFADLLLGLFVERDRIVESVGRKWVTLRHHQVNGSAYGGLIANARGLARFGQGLLGLGGSLALEVRRTMLQPAPGPGPARSLGMFTGSLQGRTWFGHAGGGLGGYGEMRVYPEPEIVTALMTNAPGFRDRRCLDAIDREWIGHV